ncbi:MAG: acyltransferase [Bdellovibrionales bacterium]|nr:acyltransferase [Bdellovibrionales bacterium]
MKPAMTAQQQHLSSSTQSALGVYRSLVTGEQGIRSFIHFECLQFFLANLPGLPGLGLRSYLYRSLFRACGRRPAFGRGMVIRRPGQIEIGDNSLFDDYSALDVRGVAGAIKIASHVSIGRFSTLSAKEASIELADGVNIGSYCRVATQSGVRIGESVLIAAYAYIGPGNHRAGDSGTPLIAQDMELKGGVEIGPHCWIGAHSTIMDGVKIGANAIVAAHSFVRDDVPERAVVAGCPARVIKQS